MDCVFSLTKFERMTIINLLYKTKGDSMSTIKDVALLANVSVTTVSRVLNRRGYISEEVRRKVEVAMEQLDYYPNQIARSLQKSQSYIIGLIVLDSNNAFFSELTKYIELYANEKNYKILLCNSNNQPKKEESYINMLKQNQVDGIIMCSHSIDIEAYTKINLPVISFDRVISNQFPYVASDNHKGGVVATEHLIGQGCKRLLHICGSMEIDVLPNKRTEGFVEVCERNNIHFKVIESGHHNLIFDETLMFIQESILPIIKEFDGVFCSSDLLAYALYTSVTGIGIKVPEELKIIGFDNDSFIRMLREPKLTTIAQPIKSISKLLTNKLISLIENRESVIEDDIVDIKLIKGDTT